MPYGDVAAYRNGPRITLHVELPDLGEPSLSGRAENLTNPKIWYTAENDGEELQIKIVVCRPHNRRRRSALGSVRYAARA